jgi:hypothetical protein
MEKRALVPPISPIRIGKGKEASLLFELVHGRFRECALSASVKREDFRLACPQSLR